MIKIAKENEYLADASNDGTIIPLTYELEYTKKVLKKIDLG